MNIESLQEKLADLSARSAEILDLVDTENRELTTAESREVDELLTKSENLEKQLFRLNKLENFTNRMEAGSGRKTEHNPIEPQNQGLYPAPGNSRISVEAPRKPKVSLGDFCLAAKNSAVIARGGGKLDNLSHKILNAGASTYSTEGVGADGGFAVPPFFQTEIMEKVTGEDSLLSLCNLNETPSSTYTLPKDESSPFDESGGVQAYWEGEGEQLTQSKIALESEILKLNKLTALVPVSEELMEDAPALDSYLRRKVPVKFDFKITDALINGTGAGRPTGILNSGCLVSVAKESGQAADTVQFENIVNMQARMYSGSWKNAVWMINQDITPQLQTMFIEGTSSSIPVYLPANSVAGKPYETLYGRPVIPSQACQTLGDKGDIILCDWSQYLAIMKTGGIRDDVSIHLYFDYDMVAYRFILRISGQPWWRTAITPKNSSNTLSCFVSLDARA